MPTVSIRDPLFQSLISFDVAPDAQNGREAPKARTRRQRSSRAIQKATSKQEIVPAPQRAIARLVFLQALGKHSHAIGELLDLHLARKREPVARDKVLRRMLRTKHPFFEFQVRFTPQTLMLMAGKPRVKEASAWAAKWGIALPWLEAWACFVGETGAAIVEPLEKTDTSTVYKAVKALAATIDLPLRAISGDSSNLK